MLLLILTLLMVTISRAETDWRSQAKECAGKYQYQRDQTQKEIIKRVKAQKDLQIEKKKKSMTYVIKYPFIQGGLSTEEAKGCVYTALSIYVHPVFMLGLAF